jgi:glycosyltransferase involved in cell wall biosynthesis
MPKSSPAPKFVLPSYYEGLPIVLLEALSYGLSCIVSDIPANREVALEDRRYFKPGDIDGMAKVVREFLHRPLTAQEKSSQIKGVAGKYNWDTIAEETLKVYRKLNPAR